uniref:ATP synthase complex subunit 8 n=1 Tax=Neochauliodes bowringi TaxID=1148301 RepID=W5QKE3_NEOBO|nr:ATP synthase F0 subunit 8 [Neochauliodes bowringi]AFB20492.1 ATP synthase F0 subunit 8 [Neochauliodes bowringi]
MPQMAPLNWLILFIFFIMLFILFNIMNYFLILPKSNLHSSYNMKNYSLTWKW